MTRTAAPVVAALLALVMWTAGCVAAAAHEVRPALLQITETAPRAYVVTWKQPVVGDMAIRLAPHLSGGALDRPPSDEHATASFLVRTWRVADGAPLEGQTVTIEGLQQTVTDVLLRVTTAEGRAIDAVIRPSSPPFRLATVRPNGLAVPAYLRLGVEHILTGADHLLFVLGLLLLIGPSWRVVKAITAFTVAHSLTLAVAALGFVRFPSAVIEALVALSILFVACELAAPDPGRRTLTRRHPWLIAFVFGLLHGFAFAGALAQVGLPARAAPQALFLFNVGVEIGQLMFIGVAIAVMLAFRAVRPRLPAGVGAFVRVAPTYAIGGLAAYWLIERVVAAV